MSAAPPGARHKCVLKRFKCDVAHSTQMTSAFTRGSRIFGQVCSATEENRIVKIPSRGRMRAFGREWRRRSPTTRVSWKNMESDLFSWPLNQP